MSGGYGGGAAAGVADGSFLVISSSVDLTAERAISILTANGLRATDGGANGTYTIFNTLVEGLAGGQTIIGGTAASENLTLRATSNATDGAIIFQSDPTTERARILSTGELGIGTAVPANILHVLRTQDATTSIRVENANAVGTSALASFAAVNDTAATISMAALGSGFVTAGLIANSGLIRTDSAITGGMMISVSAAAPMILRTTDLERARILSTGEFLIGSSTPFSLELFGVRKDQNALTIARIVNTDTGTAASARLAFDNSTNGGSVYITSTGFTPTGGLVANEFGITGSSLISSVGIVTGGASPIVFRPNATEAGRFLSGGDLNLEQNLAWKSGTSFLGTFDHAITAARTWTFPDATSTVVLDAVGKAGGQTLIGGTASGEDLTLRSTSNATRGDIIFDDSIALPRRSITANVTLDSTDHLVLADATSGNITVTLPAVAGTEGRVYVVKKIDSSANTVTIDGNAAETIDDAATKVLTSQYQSVTIQSDNSEWWIT